MSGAAAEFRNVGVSRDIYYVRDIYNPSERRGLVRDVPVGEYLLLGDNSHNSADSRSWGTVPRKDFVGRTFMALYPLERLGPIP